MPGIGIGIEIPRIRSAGALSFPNNISDPIERTIVEQLGITEAEYDANGISNHVSLRLESDLGIMLVGSDVDVWEDQSGNSNHVIAQSGNRPAYVTNEINGLPVLRSPGTGVDFQHNLSVNSTDTTIMAIAKVNAGQSGFRGIFSTKGSNYFELMLLARGPSNDEWGTYESLPVQYKASNSNIQGTGFNLLTLTKTSSEITFYRNGQDDGSDIGSAIGQPIGHVFGTTTQTMSGDVAAIYVFPSALNSTQREAIESAIATKYGIILP